MVGLKGRVVAAAAVELGVFVAMVAGKLEGFSVFLVVVIFLKIEIEKERCASFLCLNFNEDLSVGEKETTLILIGYCVYLYFIL